MVSSLRVPLLPELRPPARTRTLLGSCLAFSDETPNAMSLIYCFKAAFRDSFQKVSLRDEMSWRTLEGLMPYFHSLLGDRRNEFRIES